MSKKPLTVGGIVLLLLIMALIKVRPTIVSELLMLWIGFVTFLWNAAEWFVGLFQ